MSARPPRDRLIGVVVSIVLLLLIGWAATHRSGSDTDRETAAIAALRAAGIRQARAKVEGMEVTVYGLAEDRSQREDALRDVRSVQGVRLVTDRIVIGTNDTEPTLTPAVAVADPGPPTLVASSAAAPGLVPQPTASAPAAPPPPAATSAPRSEVPRTASPSADHATGPCDASPPGLAGQAVTFTHTSATVQGESINVLAAMARHLRECPSTMLEVRAYSTEAGSPEANLTLSRQRAHVVVGHLSRQGIATDRMVATYRGERPPGGNQAFLTLHPGASR